MSLRQQLKRATAAEHERLEARLALTGDGVSLRDYVHYLACTYAYYAAVEPILRGSRSLAAAGVTTPCCFNLNALADDLAFFGIDTPSAATPTAYVPPPDAIPQLLGCSYVLEGAALGGVVLYRRFEQKLGVARGRGATFLYGHGRETARRWAAFVGALDQAALTAIEERACVGAARATFRGMDRWFAENGWTAPAGCSGSGSP